MTQAFYNSNQLTGIALRKAVENAIKQEEAIMIVYKGTRKKLTPWDIHGMMTRAGKKWPITSARRAITNLMQKGDLIKTSDTKPGEYGVQETYYVINHAKYPSATKVEQKELF
jgi:hypothetical protein